MPSRSQEALLRRGKETSDGRPPDGGGVDPIPPEPDPVSFFNGGATPGVKATDTSGQSLGIRIDPIVDGSLTSISYYRPDAAAQTYGWIGVWDLVDNTLLVGVEWYGESGVGWRTIPLRLRAKLLATRCYVACVWLRPNASNQVMYQAMANFFTPQGLLIDGQVSAPKNDGVMSRGYANKNGMFIANSPNNFFLMPNSSFNGGNYYVDIGWVPGTYPVVPLTGYPNAANTGFKGSPDALTPLTGDQNITTAGLLYENKDIAGRLYISANNVTVRNCRISAGTGMIGADAVVVVQDGRTGVIVEDCEIYGQDTSDGIKGIWGAGTFRRNNISGSEDGIYLKAGTSTVVDNYIHDLKATGNPSPHTDGLSIDAAQTNTVLKHNTVRLNDGDGVLGGTACINITNYGGNVTNTNVEDNVCEGGGNQILLDGRFTNTPGAVISGTIIKNNVHYSFGFAPLADMSTTGTVPSGTTQIKPPPAGYWG